MKITSVSVRRLKTLSGYLNVAVEATSQVADWADPAAVREEVDLWVQAQLAEKDVTQIAAEKQELEWSVKSLQREKDRLSVEVDKLRTEISRKPPELREQLELEEKPF